MRSRFVLLSAMVVVLMCTFATGTASARPQEGFQVTPSAAVEKEYPAMGPGCPACSSRTGALNTLPSASQCGGQWVHCDAIPVEIIPPTGLADDRDIFFTIFELHWDASAENDLDFKFYDNAQSTGSHEVLGTSESTKNPEIIRAANADLGEYNLVVINYNGANTGYTIKARISTDPFTSPTEAVAPDPPKPADPETGEEEDIETPEDLSGEPPAAGGGFTPDPTLEPVTGGGAGDEDFDFGFSDLDDRLTVDQEDFAAGGATAPPPPKESVNPAVLLASLVGAPAVVVGSGAAFAWKRRRELLV